MFSADMTQSIFNRTRPTMSRHSQDAPPATRFATLAKGDRTSTAYLTSIDWPKVAALEPRSVAAWVRYLHRHGMIMTCLDLLKAAQKFLTVRPRTAQWDGYVRSGLHLALMDIVSTPGTFVQENIMAKVRSSFSQLSL